MKAWKVLAAAGAGLLALWLAGVVGGGAGYPLAWPMRAWSFGCPDLSGQWRLGGQPGVDMGVLDDVPVVHLEYGTPVSWDAVFISFDKERTLTLGFTRNADAGLDRRALLPASLRPYAERMSALYPLVEGSRATYLEKHMFVQNYRCSGGKLTLATWTLPTGKATLDLSRDRKGSLVAEYTERATDAGKPARHLWSHWPAITRADFDAAKATPHAADRLYRAAPYKLGPAGERDVETAKAEVKWQLESGAKLVGLTAAGRGAVLATIEAPDEAGIRSALDHAASLRRYIVELRRYDPTHAGAVRADVLMMPHDPSPEMAMLLGKPDTPAAPAVAAVAATPAAPLVPAAVAAPALPAMAEPPATSGMPLGEAQAAVLASMPDSILFQGLAPSPRGFTLHAHADNARAVATLLERIAKDGHFVAHPAAPDQVTLSADGAFSLELTPCVNCRR